MDWKEIQERIMMRMWRSNELSKTQAANAAWIAVNEMQKCITIITAETIRKAS